MAPSVSTRRILAGISIGLLLVILAMLTPPGGAERRGRRTQCMSQLRNVSLALQTYATNNGGRLPPAYIADENGAPMHSWRVLLLPYIEQQALYDRSARARGRSAGRATLRLSASTRCGRGPNRPVSTGFPTDRRTRCCWSKSGTPGFTGWSRVT
jgi:hypothetical protein